jgi:hypothetical protein
MKQQKFTHYAIVQLGHEVFGIGKTLSSARAHAVQSLVWGRDTKRKATSIVNGALRYAFGQSIEGDVVYAPCTKSLVDLVREEGGGIGFVWVDGGICLQSEADVS